MKQIKMPLLLAVTAGALMGFAGIASATTVTAPSGNLYTGNIEATSEGHVTLHSAFATVECNSTTGIPVESHGNGVTAKGAVAVWNFTNCTGSNVVTVFKKGSMEIHNIVGTKNGTVTSSGAEIELFSIPFEGTCIYTTNNTDVGTLTAAPNDAGHATLDVSASLTRSGGTLGAFCGATGNWTGSYKVNTPTGLTIDP